jgi:hypothetical protein
MVEKMRCERLEANALPLQPRPRPEQTAKLMNTVTDPCNREIASLAVLDEVQKRLHALEEMLTNQYVPAQLKTLDIVK